MNFFIELIKSLFDTRSDFERGADHARDCIRAGTKEVDELLQKIKEAKEFDDYNDFDRGAESILYGKKL